MRSRRFQLPPLELLPSFEAAARHLSFTKAADELALTQSAVSRQIHALEVALGGPLFERRTRALLLTERGRSFLNCAQDVLGQLDRATRALRGARDLHGVTLTEGFMMEPEASVSAMVFQHPDARYFSA